MRVLFFHEKEKNQKKAKQRTGFKMSKNKRATALAVALEYYNFFGLSNDGLTA